MDQPFPLYDRDFIAWTEEQAALLRAGIALGLDRERLAEEIGDLGRNILRGVQSQLRRLLKHLLKWEFQPGKRTRSWANSIVSARHELALDLAAYPGIGPRLEAGFDLVYAQARREAARETGLPLETFAPSCPYRLDDLVNDAFWPGPAQPHP